MSRRQASEIAAQFEQLLQDVVACITTSVLVPRRDEAGKPHRLLLNPPARLQTDTGHLEIRVVHAYNVLPDVDLGYRIDTAGYFYDATELREQGRRHEIVGYHWNPASDGDDPDFPHLHVYGNREIGGKHLSKMHLPTGRVRLEAFVRLLITDLGVIPRRKNWETVLRQTETVFLHHRRR